MSKEDPKQHYSPIPWGYEFMGKNLAPCSCGGAVVQCDGGSPKMHYFYCQSCKVQSKGDAVFEYAVFHWNELQQGRGFDVRKLHPLNISHTS